MTKVLAATFTTCYFKYGYHIVASNYKFHDVCYNYDSGYAFSFGSDYLDVLNTTFLRIIRNTDDNGFGDDFYEFVCCTYG